MESGSLLPPDFRPAEAWIPEKLPDSLDDLVGPASGVVTLPLHVCWTGMNTFDLSVFKHRLVMYHTVITEGQARDYVDFLNRHHLLTDWYVLRNSFGPTYRDPWEDRFAELRAEATKPVAGHPRWNTPESVAHFRRPLH